VKKTSLLDLLCSWDHSISRKEHYARILCGEVFIDGQCIKEPRRLVPVTVSPEYRPRRRYVSRGGDKLEGILQEWEIQVRGMSFVDAGASTGGFTDCLLRHGASRVIAIEAGRNQLDYRLRRDERVTVLENTNIMSVHTLPIEAQAAVADLSLRSLRKAAHHLLNLVSQRWLIALVKPQYEWQERTLDFTGVVSRKEDLPLILENLFLDLETEGVFVSRIAASRLPGRKGNREFFCFLSTDSGRGGRQLGSMIAKAVD
jgi:23S rRNA (cytidine1920-2'-O)/16S rRNA (cytidine1409-2'-O)-methyltransferase